VHPFASFYFELTGFATAANITTYCTSKISQGGCVPAMTWTGTPSLSAGSGFTITATGVDGQRMGRIYYGVNGRKYTPFTGGWLCVKSPLKALPLTNSGGTANTCSGSIGADFNTWIASAIDPALICGATVDAQVHFRDYVVVFGGWHLWNINFGLSDAIEFPILP
jgi:hypothetical protein